MSKGARRIIPFYFIGLLWITSWSASVNGPVMPLYIRFLGIGEREWGFLAMFQAVGMVLFEWFWGTLSDRGDRMAYMLVSMTVMSLIFPLYTLRGLVRYFIFFQFSLGTFAVIMGPVSRAIISDHAPPESIGLSMSLWSVFMTLGSMIGSVIGSYIAESWEFRGSFYLSSILSMCGVTATYLLIGSYTERGEKQVYEIGLIESFRKGLKILVSNQSLRVLLAVAVFSVMARSVIRAFLPLYAFEKIGMTTMEIGILNAVSSLTTLIASIIIGKLSEIIEKKYLVTLGFFFASLFILSYFYADTAILLYLISIGASISLSVSPLVVAILPDTIPSEYLGMSMGVFGSFENTGMMIGTAISGLIWTIYQPSYIFIVSSIFQFLSFTLILSIIIKNELGHTCVPALHTNYPFNKFKSSLCR